MGKFVDELIDYKFIYHANGVSEFTINNAEKELGLKFAEDYRDYLENFGVLSVEDVEFTGLVGPGRVHVVDITNQERRKNIEISDEWYVVVFPKSDEETIWQKASGEVIRVTADGQTTKLADSLTDYFNHSILKK